MARGESAITRRFEERAREGRKALIPYLTAGYPDSSQSLALLETIVRAGADIVELGIPFSDPLADGPTIQRASHDALAAGMTAEGALELLRAFRSGTDTPVVLFTYLNPLLAYGTERFLSDAEEAGADGLLLTDLPAGSDPVLEEMIRSGGLDLIRLVAPTTRPERVPVVVEGAQGFVYYISRTGVTGARSELRVAVEEEVGSLRRATELPVAVGFGISTPDQAARVARVADGVVVGSALIDAIDEGGARAAGSFLASLREGMDR